MCSWNSRSLERKTRMSTQMVHHERNRLAKSDYYLHSLDGRRRLEVTSRVDVRYGGNPNSCCDTGDDG